MEQFKVFSNIFFPKYGNTSIEGLTLIFIVTLALFYGFSGCAYLIFDLTIESFYTRQHISPLYYFGSAIGLFLIILALTIVTVFVPIIGQKNPINLRIFKYNLSIIFLYNYGFNFCLIWMLDWIKSINHYDKTSALDAMYVYWYVIGIFTIIFFIGKFISENSKVLTILGISGNSKKDTINQLDIPAALDKLDQIQRALDSGLIDDKTFNEMKLKIQERIKKDI